MLFRSLASFDQVLRQISNRRRFVTLHSRGAEKEVLSALRKYNMYPTVFHWYSGTHSLIEEILADGHYFSVNPAMVVSDRGKRIISLIPPDRLLTESDGPHVKIAEKAASPRSMRNLEESITHILGLSATQVSSQIAHNFAKLLPQ